MNIAARLQEFYSEAKQNKWFRYFAVFCRVVLALGFIPSGLVKIKGERFTALSSNHPLGHYFDALHATGYYYTFLGVSQLIIAVLLLIPVTAVLGALAYFPIIFNIAVLTYAARFEGIRIITLMVLANLYLLCWYYDRLKYILPFKQYAANINPKQNKPLSKKFPWKFFAFVFAVAASVIIIIHFLYEIRPHNSLIECRSQCKDSKYSEACENFCDCIHNQGKPLDSCLAAYERAKGKR